MKPESPVQNNNLVVFPVNIPMCTPISYAWYICIAQFVISNIGLVKPRSPNSIYKVLRRVYHQSQIFEIVKCICKSMIVDWYQFSKATSKIYGHNYANLHYQYLQKCLIYFIVDNGAVIQYQIVYVLEYM